MSKTRVAVIFGGTNTEHEVSLQSAKAVINNLDKTKFEIIPIKITKETVSPERSRRIVWQDEQGRVVDPMDLPTLLRLPDPRRPILLANSRGLAK